MIYISALYAILNGRIIKKDLLFQSLKAKLDKTTLHT
jgi:hypothetical protein